MFGVLFLFPCFGASGDSPGRTLGGFEILYGKSESEPRIGGRGVVEVQIFLLRRASLGCTAAVACLMMKATFVALCARPQPAVPERCGGWVKLRRSAPLNLETFGAFYQFTRRESAVLRAQEKYRKGSDNTHALTFAHALP